MSAIVAHTQEPIPFAVGTLAQYRKRRSPGRLFKSLPGLPARNPTKPSYFFLSDPPPFVSFGCSFGPCDPPLPTMLPPL